MNALKRQLASLIGLTTLWATVFAGNAGAPVPPGAAGDTAPPVNVTGIVGLCDAGYEVLDSSRPSDVGLNDVLWVVVRTNADGEASSFSVAKGCKGIQPAPVSASSAPGAGALQAGGQTAPTVAAGSQPGQIDPAPYALYLNGDELEAKGSAVYDDSRHALGFRLTRNAGNTVVWAKLLGSPTSLSRRVDVALKNTNPSAPQTLIVGSNGAATFKLRIASLCWLLIAAGATIAVLFLVFGHLQRQATLRDGLLPQLEASLQTYSLGRCQMAFWFVLIFAAFLFLYIVLWDYNTVSSQALALMGISSATALASIEVDVLKDSPADAVNRALQALGLNSHQDVQRLENDIASGATQLSTLQINLATAQMAAQQSVASCEAAPGNAALAAAAQAALAAAAAAQQAVSALTVAQQDRSNILRTFKDKSAPFVTQGWFRDLTTDVNGPTIHRLQVLIWTITLGIVFLIGVYRDLAMPPDFSPTLLALMGISSAGYVGFKWPERNS
ncbi:MAG TPA: hypothetical protein VGR92_04325 [Steroidobacteraceae bacterium]|nr:hypothetical protein [Steroidobacteraceae bacterium]